MLAKHAITQESKPAQEMTTPDGDTQREDDHVLVTLPNQETDPLPPGTKFLHQFNINKIQESSPRQPVLTHTSSNDHVTTTQQKRSAHRHCRVSKNENSGTQYLLKYLQGNNPKDPGGVMAMLESVAANYCKLLVDDLVPSTHAIYDEQTMSFIAVISKLFENFKPNSEDPLNEMDLIIGFDTQEVAQSVTSLKEKLTAIKRLLVTKSVSIPNSLFSTLNYYNPLSGPISSKFQLSINEYLSSVDHLSSTATGKLLTGLRERLEHIKNSADGKHQEEIKLLIESINLVNRLETALKRRVEYLEEIDRDVKKNNVDIKNKNDQEYLTGEINNLNFNIHTTYRINVRSLKNYRLQKGLGRLLIARFSNQEGDLHNNNFSKYGYGIDFDMAELLVLWWFRSNSYGDETFRKPSSETFRVIAEEMKKWPDINRPNLGYWPTSTSVFTNSVVTLYAKFYDVTVNFFTWQDNELFKKLNQCPVFMFFSYMIALKFILSTQSMYENINKIHLSEHILFNTEKNTLSVSDALIENKMDRVAEFRKIFTQLEPFKNFIHDHGDYVFDMIKEEYRTYRDKYAKKIEEKPHFQQLVDNMDNDLAALKSNYEKLCQEMGLSTEKDYRPTEVSVQFEIKDDYYGTPESSWGTSSMIMS